jgi:hypothetical protein
MNGCSAPTSIPFPERHNDEDQPHLSLTSVDIRNGLRMSEPNDGIVSALLRQFSVEFHHDLTPIPTPRAQGRCPGAGRLHRQPRTRGRFDGLPRLCQRADIEGRCPGSREG